MEIAAATLAVVATMLAVVVGLLANFGHRELPLWLGFVTIVLYALGFCCWYQDWLWKKDAREASQAAGNVVELRPDERPWIVVEAAEFSRLEVGKIPQYTIRIKNTGRTPAKITERRTGLLILGKGMTEDDLKEEDIPVIEGPKEDVALAPDTAVFMPVTNEIFNVPEDFKTDIDSGARKLFVVGRVSYRDISGRKCFTTICLQYDPKFKRLNIFPRYNRMECE